MTSLVMVPLAQIDRPAEMVRPIESVRGIEGLAASIREHGLLNPVTVVRREYSYRLVAGVRRCLAAQRAGLECVPATVVEADGRRAYELGLVENVLRQSMDPIDEAKAIRTLMRLHGIGLEAVSRRLGRSLAWSEGRLKLLTLEEGTQATVREGTIGVTQGARLASATPERQEAAVRAATPRPSTRAAIAGRARTRGPATWFASLSHAVRSAALTDEEGAELAMAVAREIERIKGARA